MGKKSDGSQQSQEETQDSQEQQPESQIDYKELVKSIFENMPKQQTVDIDALTKALNKEDKGRKHQAHGLTQDEMKQVKLQQSNGEVEMMPANQNSRYQIPVYEKNLMHFTTEKVEYKDGEKISKPRVHVKTAEDFIRMSKTVKEPGDTANPENAFAGLEVKIYHDVRKGAKAKNQNLGEKTREELLLEMSEKQLQNEYLRLYGEEPLPSDSKNVLIEMIKDKYI